MTEYVGPECSRASWCVYRAGGVVVGEVVHDPMQGYVPMLPRRPDRLASLDDAVAVIRAHARDPIRTLLWRVLADLDGASADLDTVRDAIREYLAR